MVLANLQDKINPIKKLPQLVHSSSISKFLKSLNISLTTRFYNLNYVVTQIFFYMMDLTILGCKFEYLSSKMYPPTLKTDSNVIVDINEVSQSRVMTKNTR